MMDRPQIDTSGAEEVGGGHGSARSKAAFFAIFLVAATGVAALFRLSAPNVSDPDSFYHFRHAAIYAEEGLGYASFPWLVCSAVSQFSADLGYGFHVLLIPFTFVRDGILGIKLAAIFETVVVLALMYLVMRRHRIAGAWGWPFVLFLLGPPMTYTFLMARPQTLTMGFCALLLSFLVRGSVWGVLVASFAICFFHLNILIIVPAVVVVVAVVKGVTAGWGPSRCAATPRAEPSKWLAALMGMGLGVALRPNPVGAVKLGYVQFAVHEMVRAKGLPLLFGREWLPLSIGNAATIFTWFLVVWAGLGALFLVAALAGRVGGSTEDRILLWASLALSVLFFAVMVIITKRATPLWATCAVIFVAKAFSQLLGATAVARPALPGETRLVLAALVVVVLGLMAGDVIKEHLVRQKWVGRSSYRLYGAAEWLKEHSRRGEIVYNVNWDMFPELFFWNTQNRYVSGLDPIFLFAYDQGWCWKAHHLQTGEATSQTWPSPRSHASPGEDTYAVVKRDFGASYLALEPRRNAELNDYLAGDARFERKFGDGDAVVYALK